MRGRTVIIADDDSDSRAQLENSIAALGFEIVTASGRHEIVAAASGHHGYIVLAPFPASDLEPELQLLRQELGEGPANCYLILILDSYTRKRVTAAFDAGADDVIARPLIGAELDARLRNAAKALTLEEMCEHVDSEAALFDAIVARSSFHSRAYFDAQLANELTRASRFAHPVSLILAHVESTPWYDRGMRTLSRFLAERCRADIDWLARYDEHRLAFVLPETPLPGALRATKRLESTLSQTALRSSRRPVPTGRDTDSLLSLACCATVTHQA